MFYKPDVSASFPNIISKVSLHVFSIHHSQVRLLDFITSEITISKSNVQNHWTVGLYRSSFIDIFRKQNYSKQKKHIINIKLRKLILYIENMFNVMYKTLCL